MTVGAAHLENRAGRPEARRSKLIGLAFLVPPLVMFAAFGIGEGIGGEEGWWGHLIQLALTVLLALGAWMRPRIGGPALIVVGIALTVWAFSVQELAGAVGVLAIVGAPVILSGGFFVRAGNAE